MSASRLQPGQWVSRRYRVERSLGRGGVAEVFAAYDQRAQRTVALKCLLSHVHAPEHAAALFRHEFVVLSQVTHPSVVSAYDFGVDEGLTYYAMELIDGVPLSGCAPLAVADAERMLDCLCEALSLLHARRWVHRDLSSQNVLRTPEGQIKLIDFGATASMGERHPPVGTPPFMAPEVLHQEALDARADIFGLGALAYFALTGRHAYPARTLTALYSAWENAPGRPSDLVEGISQTLSELLLSMLSLEHSARPRSMVEVQHRLRGGTFASLPPSPTTARAYLDMPKLVGRDAQVAQLRAAVRGACVRHGAVCVVFGDSGSGRSRMLDFAALEARVAGHRVIRASARQAEPAPLSLARTLALAVAEALTGSAKQYALRARAPSWLSGVHRCDDETELVSVQRELLRWFGECFSEAPFALLIDDFDCADGQSQRCFVQLGAMAQTLHLSLVVSTLREAAHADIMRKLLGRAASVELYPLSGSQVEDWTRSVFGDVPNVARLARWLSTVSAGNPGACTVLAQHLVERAVVTLSGGSFRLPDHFDQSQLPVSMHDALCARLAQLDGCAARLLQRLAIEAQPLARPVAAYVDAFVGRGDDGIATLKALACARVLCTGSRGYELEDHAALRWARDQLDPERRRVLHRELARWHRDQARADEPTPIIYACYHLWLAGDLDEADALLGEGRALHRATTGSAARFSRSDEGIALYEGLLRHRREKARSPAAIQQLLQTLLSLAQSARPELSIYADECVARLCHDLGCDLWDALPTELSGVERVTECLRRAAARYAQTPEHERGLPVLQAVQRMAVTVAIVAGIATVRYEPELLPPLLPIIERLSLLSPGLMLVAQTTRVSYASLSYGANISALQRQIVEQSAQPIEQLEEPTREAIHAINSYYLAMHLASAGRAEALELAPRLEASALYAALGLQVRRIHALMTGRYGDAQRYRRERELLSLQSEASDHHLQMSLLREAGAAYASADVLELARHTSATTRRAQRFAGWQPWATLCQALLRILSHQYDAARTLLDQGLSLVAPFAHSAYSDLSAIKALVLVELGEYEAADALVAELLRGARERGIVLDKVERLHAVQAAAAVARGEVDAGLGQLQALVDAAACSPGRQSLVYGELCEIGCKIALQIDDAERFAAYWRPIAELYAQHAGLRARAERLQRSAHERFQGWGQGGGALAAELAVDWRTRIAAVNGTQNIQEQADYLLSLLLDHADAQLGQLYRIDGAGTPTLLAARPGPADPTLLAHAMECCSTRVSLDGATHSMSGLDQSAVGQCGRRYHPLWLCPSDQPDAACGLLLIAAEVNRLSLITPDLRHAVVQHLQQLG